MADAGLTEQQRKWMASVRSSLETSTGRSMADWVGIARTCPETMPRARLRWFKEQHGLGQNYASVIQMELAAQSGDNPRDPDALGEALWADPTAKAIFTSLQAAIAALPHVVTGQRKTYTTWSRSFAFACARPVRGGQARLGPALDPEADPRLQAAANEGWSERLKSTLVLSGPKDVDDTLRALLQAAWERG